MIMQCYLCKSPNLEVVRTTLRHGIERAAYRCRACSLNFLEPKSANLQEYYGHEYRATHSPVVGVAQTSVQVFDMYLPFQEARAERMRGLLQPDARLLEIGCSAGHFLATVKKYVAEVVGIEYNVKDVDFIKNELKLRAYTDPVDKTDLPKGYFDVICAFQIFEHVDDPLAFLQTIKPYLKPGGTLLLELPNAQEALLAVYDIPSFHDFWYREPHLFNYTPKTLAMMLEKAGFAGEVRTIQRINFRNHLHWLETGTPQKGPFEHMTPSRLVADDEKAGAVGRALNEWMKKIDAEYGAILSKHGNGESLLYIGHPV